jgi:hypothetical protein
VVCGEPYVVLPMEQRSLEASAVAMTPSLPPLEPCQPLAFVDRGGVLDPNYKTLFERAL